MELRKMSIPARLLAATSASMLLNVVSKVYPIPGSQSISTQTLRHHSIAYFIAFCHRSKTVNRLGASRWSRLRTSRATSSGDAR